MSGQATMVEVLRWQSRTCGRIGSPLYERLLAAVADDVEAGGPCWEVLEAHADGDRASMPVLRFMGAVHRLVLRGGAPELARFYPSAGGEDDGDPWPAFRATVAAHTDALREDSHRGVQTNEVGRSGVLLGGFLLVAQATGLPLRLLELGSSGGLNLRWDAYRYADADARWGDPASPVRIAPGFDGATPPLDVAASVAQRRGCDPQPIDLTSEEGRLTLLSFSWPDQRWRVDLLEGALALAERVPVAVDAEPAATWLRSRLSEPADGMATVVFHSIVMQYLPDDERTQVEALVRAAGTRATDEAPVAWLRMEPESVSRAGVWLDLWPSGRHALVARAGYHGRPTQWYGWDGPPE